MDNSKPTFVASWFGTAFITFFFSISFLVYISTTLPIKPANYNFKLYAALPSTQLEVSDSIEYIDARAKIVENFFVRYNSSLAPLASSFVQAADKYKLDYRLLPAISMQESNGAKRQIKDSYNPFGFGIYGSKVIKFSSFEEAIEVVAKTLREDYLDIGLNTPEEIMIKYTPPSASKGGPWAKGVSSFMEEMK